MDDIKLFIKLDTLFYLEFCAIFTSLAIFLHLKVH